MPTYTDTQLDQELQQLRQQVALLRQAIQRPQVSLEASRAAPFLGQSVIMTGIVTDAGGNSVLDAPVIVSTTWGRLRSRDRIPVEQGTSLAVRTGADGRFSVELLPPTSEDLLAVQQEALETFLVRLDSEAETPRQTEAGLLEMAQLYQWDTNFAFRQAIDIYFRDFGQGLLESVNAQDYLDSWNFLEATLVAYVQEPGKTAVQSSAAMLIPFKQWLGPWLEVFLTLSQERSPLGSTLEVMTRGGNAGVLMDGVYQRVADYVGSQPGIVGAYIGRKVVETTVQTFLLEGLAELDVDARAALVPSLQAATGTLATTGVGGLTTLVQTRNELKREVGTQIESSGLAVGALTNRVTDIATQLAQVDGQVASLSSGVGGLTSRLATLQGSFEQLDTSTNSQLTQFGGRIDQLQGNVGGLTTQVTDLSGNVERLDANTATRFDQLGTRLGTLEGRLTVVGNNFGTVLGRVDSLETSVMDFGNTLGVLDNVVADVSGSFRTFSDRLNTQAETIATLQAQNQDFDGRLTTFQTSNQEMDGRVTKLNEEVVGLRQDTIRLDQNITQVNTSVDGLQRNLSTVNNQVNRLDTRVTTVQGSLTTLTNQVSTLDTRVVTLDTRVGTLDNRIGVFDDRLGIVTRDLTLINTNVGTLQTRVNQVDTRLTSVSGQVGRLETNVTTLDGRFTNLNGQVGGLERNLGNLSRLSTERMAVLENSISRVGNNVLSLRTDLNR
jgi:chromosome segregation ATPase